MTSIQPLHNRIVVKRIGKETMSAGGIVIPDTIDEKPSQGRVVAVGPGTYNKKGELESLSVVVGDEIIFGKQSGDEITVDGEKLLVMYEDAIIAIVR